MKKFWLGFLKALLLSAVFALGAYAAQTKSIRDFAQRQVQVPENIRSVATLGSVGVLNCFIFAMGEGDKIANAFRLDLPKPIGGSTTINLILRLKTTL